MKKTTVNLDDRIWYLVRERAKLEGKPVGRMINDLLAEVFASTLDEPEWIGMSDLDIDDAGINLEKYLYESFAGTDR